MGRLKEYGRTFLLAGGLGAAGLMGVKEGCSSKPDFKEEQQQKLVKGGMTFAERVHHDPDFFLHHLDTVPVEAVSFVVTEAVRKDIIYAVRCVLDLMDDDFDRPFRWGGKRAPLFRSLLHAIVYTDPHFFTTQPTYAKRLQPWFEKHAAAEYTELPRLLDTIAQFPGQSTFLGEKIKKDDLPLQKERVAFLFHQLDYKPHEGSSSDYDGSKFFPSVERLEEICLSPGFQKFLKNNVEGLSYGEMVSLVDILGSNESLDLSNNAALMREAEEARARLEVAKKVEVINADTTLVIITHPDEAKDETWFADLRDSFASAGKKIGIPEERIILLNGNTTDKTEILKVLEKSSVKKTIVLNGHGNGSPLRLKANSILNGYPSEPSSFQFKSYRSAGDKASEKMKRFEYDISPIEIAAALKKSGNVSQTSLLYFSCFGEFVTELGQALGEPPLFLFSESSQNRTSDMTPALEYEAILSQIVPGQPLTVGNLLKAKESSRVMSREIPNFYIRLGNGLIRVAEFLAKKEEHSSIEG